MLHGFLLWLSLALAAAAGPAAPSQGRAPAPLPGVSGAPPLNLAPGTSLAPAIAAALVTPFPSQVHSELVTMTPSIDSLPARWIEDDGLENTGILAYTREGSRRIMKITDHRVDWDGPESHPKHTGEVQYRGHLLGALFGGPQVLRAGIVSRPWTPDHYFIEMEELFPDQDGASLKSMEQKSKDYSRLSLAPDGRSATRVMAERLVQVFEHGIIPNDADFFVSKEGRTAWIDTARWRLQDPKESPADTEKAMAWEVSQLAGMLSRDLAAADAFLFDYLAVLKRSTLSESRKAALRDGPFRSDWAPRLLQDMGWLKPEDQGSAVAAARRVYAGL